MNPPRFGDDDAAGPDHVDPSHIIALAQRLGNLAGQLSRLVEREEERDREIRALRQDIAELDNDLKQIAERVPTKEQMAAITKILAEQAGWDWFKGRLRYYGWGLLALLGGIYIIRDWISQFSQWISRVVK